MENSETLSRTDYLQAASWQELYIITEHWRSDLDFYRDEIRFFYNLVDKYMIWITKDENLVTVGEMLGKLNDLDKKQVELSASLGKHLHNLENLMENDFSHDGQEAREAHGNLENEIAYFVKDVRAVKKNVFSITEHVIETEKLQHLLTD